MDCIFCKIAHGEIPADRVYEDEEVLAFLDINPVNPGHTLIIPKNHYANFEELPESTLTAVMKIVKKIGRDMKEKLGYEGYNAYENNDPVAGQIIHHFHFHVIPRRVDDGLKLWESGHYNYAGEAQDILAKLKNN